MAGPGVLFPRWLHALWLVASVVLGAVVLVYAVLAALHSDWGVAGVCAFALLLLSGNTAFFWVNVRYGPEVAAYGTRGVTDRATAAARNGEAGKGGSRQAS